MKLSPAELASRLTLDFKVATGMSCSLVSVSAHRSLDEASAARQAIVDPAEGHLARFYRAEYKVRTLVGPGKYSASTTVVIDLLANGNYPLSEPACWVISRPMPWSPHFREGLPICLGELWTAAKGEILLARLLSHIAQLLNYDEVAREPGYAGWNGEAIRYWKAELGGKPITPGLAYPVPDPALTHGLATGAAVFRSPSAKPPAVFRMRHAS